ncbi:MAG: hypothetical protein JWN83_1369 [Chitinophagaceae bacterium]|nr:hypothetical protein [Chitinophagaceae bacterium]
MIKYNIKMICTNNDVYQFENFATDYKDFHRYITDTLPKFDLINLNKQEPG